MKPALTRLPLAALLAASSLAIACSGDGGPGAELNCEIRVTPGALALGTLCLDASSTGTFEIENTGAAECLVDLSLAGKMPQHFGISAEQLVIPPAGGKQAVTVTYHPSVESGAATGEQHIARVMITSNAKENPNFELSVDGETGSTETKGILSLSCGDTMKRCPEKPDGEPCCRVVSLEGPTTNGPPYYGRNYISEVNFGDVQKDQSVTVPLKVTNLGCGQLDVSQLTFNATTGDGFCDPAAVSVVTAMPVSVDGSVSAQQRQSAPLELKFNPTQPNCNYFAGVKVTSNDPDIVDGQSTAVYGKFNLQGSGTQGLLVSHPGAVAFGDVATGITVRQKVEISNNGRRLAEVSSVALRSAAGVFQIEKLERPNCDGTTTDFPLGGSFTLEETDLENSCGPDQMNAIVAFTPNDAGDFENYLEVDYGFGLLSVHLSGRSRPKLVVKPDQEVRFFGPRSLSCDPLTCTMDDVPNPSCAGLCASDDDCSDGSPCLGGVCGGNQQASCTETCGAAERVIRLCNDGHAPLRFDNAADGGGLVITGAGGGSPPVHTKVPGITDPARDGKPLFTIVDNNCADTAGNGVTLQPDACCEATIHYLDTRNGGSPEGKAFYEAELHVYTNDPAYPRDAAKGGGFNVAVKARSDYDFDPVARFTAYDLDLGVGVGPRQGKMAVLDAGASVDPTCDWSNPGCDQGNVNPITSYRWEFVAISGVGEYVPAMVGPIDLSDPNKNCPVWLNNGVCFEVPPMGAETGRIIRFYPDAEAPRNYKIRLTVTDGVCSPPHQGWTEDDIQVSG